MDSKIMPLLCLLSCLYVRSSSKESMIQEVKDAQNLGVLKTLRTQPPSSYLMKIKSFSLLAKADQQERYESTVFEAAGYKWRLVLYPNGNKNASGAGYISLYLAIQGSNFISNHWEVYADVKFFVYNQPQDKFLTVQDGELKRFHVVNTEWGFAEVLPLTTFKDSKNGYLVNDYCAFGVEVYVVEPTKKWEEFYSINPKADEAKFNWKIKSFSKLDKEFYFSGEFTAAGIVWYLKIYPKGYATGEGNSISLYLFASGYENSKPQNDTLYANYKLRVVNQGGRANFEREYTVAFYPRWYGWGSAQFMPLADLRDPSKGYLVNDALVVESEIFKVSKTKYFPPRTLATFN